MKKYLKYAFVFGIIKKAVILLFLLSSYSFAQLDKYFNIVAKNENEDARTQFVLVKDFIEKQ
jgi:hypothetical protein